MKKNNILVTGSSGFIGFHICKYFLKKNINVIGIDNHNNYYDPRIKDARLSILTKYSNYHHYRVDLSDKKKLDDVFMDHKPKKVVNLAAQAGVRYSMENPLAYINSNIDNIVKGIDIKLSCNLKVPYSPRSFK